MNIDYLPAADGSATRVRSWTKPQRNAPCPCGAYRSRSEVLDAAYRGGGEERRETMERVLDHRRKAGLVDGLPRKFKNCHQTERQLVNEGIAL